jgi:hypothetical protein
MEAVTVSPSFHEEFLWLYILILLQIVCLIYNKTCYSPCRNVAFSANILETDHKRSCSWPEHPYQGSICAIFSNIVAVLFYRQYFFLVQTHRFSCGSNFARHWRCTLRAQSVTWNVYAGSMLFSCECLLVQYCWLISLGKSELSHDCADQWCHIWYLPRVKLINAVKYWFCLLEISCMISQWNILEDWFPVLESSIYDWLLMEKSLWETNSCSTAHEILLFMDPRVHY